MSKPVFKEEHPYVTLEVRTGANGSELIGTLSYMRNENGELTGPTIDSIRSQFLAIYSLLDEQGGMLRLGTIMLGYHNHESRGDVLLPDGEIIGCWESNDEDWCSFTKDGDEIPCLNAPSPWLLQDSIASWLANHDD